MSKISAECDNIFVKLWTSVFVFFFRNVFQLTENLALYQPTWERFPLPYESRDVRMQWTECTLNVVLEVNVHVQYLMTANTVLHGE